MAWGQAMSSDDARISEIRDIHVAGVGISAHVCANCYDEWPCDTAYLLARVDALAAERHAAVARAERAEADRDEWHDKAIVMAYAVRDQMSLAETHIIARQVIEHDAALAASSGEPAPVTTRTVQMRCHCGRGVTIGADPWCEGCVQSAATCDCVPLAASSAEGES